jgi:steroid delta-isomerase-like uncharacterized protein
MTPGTTERAAALATLKQYYDAFNAGDHAAMLACLTDDVAHDINQGGRETGKAAFRKFLAHMERTYAERLEDVVLMADESGTRGASEFIVHGQYLKDDEGLPPAKGQRYVLPAGGFFDFRDGQISRVTVYYNLADWIAQVSG